MSGTAYVDRKDQKKLLSLENVANISVAGDFIIFQFDDGSAVIERSEYFNRVQFTPYAEGDGETNQETPGSVNHN